MNYTTLEQSKKLVELGLNPDTADMIYYDYKFTGALSIFNGKAECTEYKNCTGDIHVIPCWSLGALIELMPNEITTDELTDTPIEIHKYGIGYQGRKSQGVVYFGKGDSLTNNAVLLVIWLLENNYIEEGFLNTKGEKK